MESIYDLNNSKLICDHYIHKKFAIYLLNTRMYSFDGFTGMFKNKQIVQKSSRTPRRMPKNYVFIVLQFLLKWHYPGDGLRTIDNESSNQQIAASIPFTSS